MEEEILSFVNTSLVKGRLNVGSSEAPLFSSGLIDSFGMVELLSHLYKEYGADIDPAVVNIERLDTIADIVRMVNDTRVNG